MSAKTEILAILESCKGKNISGEELATRLNITRAAVWKAIKSLKQEGYEIKAVNNLGYSLAIDSDILSVEAITPYINPNLSVNLFVHKIVDSTNKEAKTLALAGASQGTCVVAEEQSLGRGRLGRSFFSPKGKGIYVSMVLKPTLNLTDSILITSAAAVAVCRAIAKLTTKSPTIKWVNDLYLGDKKICGILTEAVSDFETGTIESLVLGIGVNFAGAKEDFPPELQEICGTLFEDQAPTLTRNQLVAEIINQVLELMPDLPARKFIAEYKNLSWVLGHKIKFSQGDAWQDGMAVDIDLNGGLVVETQGKTIVLNSGEISIRKV